MKVARLFFIVAALLPWKSPADEPAQAEVFHHEQVLGTSLELKVFGVSHEQALRAESAVLAEIDRLAGILSSYDADSEVNRWMRTRDEAVPVSKELGEVLGLFAQWRVKTGGALDPAAGAVCKLWRDAEAKQQLPTPDATKRAVATVRQLHWRLDAGASRATHLSDAPLVFNSMTKSFIIERAAAAAMAVAAPSGLVLNIGGDLVVRGAVEETVAIADPSSDAENARPLDTLVVANSAVATSGGYRRGYEINGRRFSHIVDPRTGRTADDVLSATVVARDAADAGALATALCVMTPAESARLIVATPGADYLIVMRDGRRLTSAGWDQLERPVIQLADVGDACGTPGTGAPPAADRTTDPVWDDSMELVINLELSRVQDARYRRPYVAVWIEDKDKFPVRTLALWYQKPRWLPDLKTWHRGDQLRALADGTDLAKTISSATRSAGKYSLKWDGKDDKGAPVKPGKYTVCIEAAREHGTYQLMRKEIDFNGAPSQATLPGNPEIAGASLDYHRKAAR